jgi:hypothetical protein
MESNHVLTDTKLEIPFIASLLNLRDMVYLAIEA